MRRIATYLLLLVIALFSSCVLATFDRYPGQRLNEIPRELQGNYRPVVKDVKADLADSTVLVLGPTWWDVVELEKTTRYHMGDTIILSTWNNHYFISVRTYNQKYWYVFVPEIKPDGSVSVRPIVARVKRKKINRYLKRISKDDNTQYEPVFCMDEEHLLRYYHRVIEKHPGIQLLKISP